MRDHEPTSYVPVLRIWEIVKKSGLERYEICRDAEISEVHLCKIVKGKVFPSFEVAMRLQKALKTELRVSDFFDVINTEYRNTKTRGPRRVASG